ncbi:hypothetical protein JCM31598_28080 [Desulfonatronum parangueonense]
MQYGHVKADVHRAKTLLNAGHDRLLKLLHEQRQYQFAILHVVSRIYELDLFFPQSMFL